MAIIKTKFNRGVEGATNIVDAGTEGTRVGTGTTVQRGSTTGQWRFNTDTGYFEGRNPSGFSTLEPTPTVTSVNDTEVDSGGGGNQTIVVTGTNFSSGGTIAFVGTSAEFNATTTTFNSSTQVTAVAPKASFLNAQEPYKVKFSSTSGLSGTSGSGLINVDNEPTWSTASGQIGGSIDEGDSVNTSATATDTDGDTIVYSVQSGSLPSGLSLNTGTGAITGTAGNVSSDTTSNFTLRATANTKTADRAFSIVIKNNLLTVADFFGDSSGKSLYNFQSDGTDAGGVANWGFGHPSSGTNQAFVTGRFSNGVQLVYGGNYGHQGYRNYSNFTVAQWFKPASLASNSQDFKGIFGHQNTGQYIVSKSGSNYYLGLQMSAFSNGNHPTNGDKYIANASGCPTLSDGTWSHLIWTRDGTDSRLYVNGVLGVTITEDISTISLGTSGSIYLGTASSQLGVATYGTEGIHDNLRIFNKKLSQSEITTLYNYESSR